MWCAEEATQTMGRTSDNHTWLFFRQEPHQHFRPSGMHFHRPVKASLLIQDMISDSEQHFTSPYLPFFHPPPGRNFCSLALAAPRVLPFCLQTPSSILLVCPHVFFILVSSALLFTSRQRCPQRRRLLLWILCLLLFVSAPPHFCLFLLTSAPRCTSPS